MTARLIDTLYGEAMVLADEARGYFDGFAAADQEALAPLDRVIFSCESLKVTTRLMQVIAWLLYRKAEAAGEVAPCTPHNPAVCLGRATPTSAAVLSAMPASARALIESSMALHRRIARIDRESLTATNPARALISRLEQSL